MACTKRGARIRAATWGSIAGMALAAFGAEVPTYAASTPTVSSGAAVLSLPAYYQVTKTVTLQNTGQGNALNVTASVVLQPAAVAYASLSPTSENITPSQITRDQFGNLIAHFQLGTMTPGQKIQITFTYQATSEDVSYDLPNSYGPYNTDSALYTTYTNPQLEQSAGVNSDAPQIVALDKQLAGGVTNPLTEARIYFNWVAHNIHYNWNLQAAGGAVAVLKTRSGICSDFADLYTAMLRTAGIPARLVDGYVTNNGGGQAGFHQWVEFYLPKVGWVAADPTWGRFGYFATLSDDWHIPLYIGNRTDVNTEWQRLPTTRPYVAANEHYSFTAEKTPPQTHSLSLPLLASPQSTTHRVNVVNGPVPFLASLLADARGWMGALVHTLGQLLHDL